MAINPGDSSLAIRSIDDEKYIYETEEERDEREKREYLNTYNEANQFRKLGMNFEGFASHLYTTVQPSGLCAMLFAWWWCYPTWCRYRHVNVGRYTKPQIQFRRKWFSVNIPKIVNPNEKRSAPVVMGLFLLVRWMNSNLVLPEVVPEEAYDALGK